MPSRRKPLTRHVFPRPNNLSLAISSVLAVPAGAVLAQDQAGAEADATDLMLEEVLVTARKRAESLMEVPESIQALSAQDIREGGLKSMDDYVRFIPSMSYVQTNPGTSMVIFRGIADDAASQIAEASAALYLDEQSLVMNATPDPRLVDIERIEALSGPQGTLYGASSQSGTLRIITNKPDPEAFDAFVDVALKTGSDSDGSYDVSGMVNIPLSDTLAIRLVGFSVEEGGFIDNIAGVTPRFGLYENTGAEQDDYNDVEISGGRVAARWFANDEWTVTGGVTYQDTRSDARPEMDSTLGRDLAIVRFYPDQEYDDQDWTQFSLTLEGDLGFADFVSATSYFERDWTYAQDTSVGYASYFGTFCYGAYLETSKYCFQPAGVGAYYNDPVGYLENIQKNTKFSQEFRLTAEGERLDWVAGLYYEESDEDWDFYSHADGYATSQSMENLLAERASNQPNAPTVISDTWWHSADRTDWRQYAVFGEFTFHLTETWDATIGARWFDRTMDKVYYVENPDQNLAPPGLTMPQSDESDWVPKFSLSWQMSDNLMLYGLYSEGFRPGGTNRGRSVSFFPVAYSADTLENIEFGAKATLAEGRVQLTGAYFDMTWDDYQLEVVDPSNLSCDNPVAPPPPLCGLLWQRVVANVGKASSKGIELQLDAAVTAAFTLGVNATWLDATLDEDVFVTVPVPAGSRLPLSPEFKASAWLQYDWDINWFGGLADHSWLRLQWSYTDDMLNIVEPLVIFDDGPSPQILQPSYDIGDLRYGVGGEDWTVQLFVNNLTDERAILFANPFEFDYFFGHARETVNRPREYGLRFIKEFGGP